MSFRTNCKKERKRRKKRLLRSVTHLTSQSTPGTRPLTSRARWQPDVYTFLLGTLNRIFIVKVLQTKKFQVSFTFIVYYEKIRVSWFFSRSVSSVSNFLSRVAKTLSSTRLRLHQASYYPIKSNVYRPHFPSQNCP